MLKSYSIKEFIRKHGPVNLDAGKPFFNETIIKKISRYENFIIFKTDFSVPSFTGNIFSYKRFFKDITKPAIYNPKADLGVPNHIMLPTSKAPYLEPIDIANIQKGNTKLIFQLIEAHQDAKYTSDAYFSMINYYRLKDDPTNESDIFKKFSDTFNNDSSILNQYAWRMTELGVNLDDALDKSNQAISLSDDDLSLKAYIIDTKAEILWLLGRIDEAIVAINLAIEINPDDEYLIEQRDKFLNSINKGSENDN